MKTSSNNKGQRYCIDYKKEIVPNALRCRECFNKHRVVETPINKKELKSLIRIKSFVEIGKLYNVSDNAIRKWCIKCGLPSKRKNIRVFSDEE